MTTPNPIEAGEERMAEIARPTPEQIATRIVDRFIWTSNVMRGGKLVSTRYVAAEAIAAAIADERSIASLPDKREPADHIADVGKMVAKSHAALRLALPLLEQMRERISERFRPLDATEHDTAIKAIRDALGEDE